MLSDPDSLRLELAVDQDHSNSDVLLIQNLEEYEFAILQAGLLDSSCTPQLTILIDDPQALFVLGTQMSQDSETAAITVKTNEPLSSNTEDNTFSLNPTTIKILQIAILAPITPSTSLTLSELNGAIDGPFTSNLVTSWRRAFRALPKRHSIELVKFDMSCQRKLEVRHIVRLLQEVGTGIYVKAKRTMGREVRFEVVGCGDEGKMVWLEGSLPGGREK